METHTNQVLPRTNNSQRQPSQPQNNQSLQNANQGLPSLQTFNHLEEPNILSNILKEQKEKNSKGDPESARIATKEKLREFQIPAKWEWLPCNYELKREEKSIETHWSLSPTIQLIGNDQKNPPIMDISINLERPFMHNDELGWNWHKSWNLPNLTISIKINDAISNDPILPPADLKAQLFAVKVLLNKSEQFKLYDLGLKGSTVQDLSEGQCTFSAIKFSSTSYNNDGVKFHLIVLIYIQDDTRSRACPRILYSRISPPIFVDSRKSARDSNVTRNKKIVCKYFDPFPADTFEKTFIKRNTKLNESKEEIIENSLGGLSQYFTAPNIRNKVKHPVFLAAKFSNCVRLFYNANLMKIPLDKEKKEEDMIIMMQKVLMESSFKEKGESTNSSKAFDNKYFILLIEEPSNLDSFQLNKKISDYLEPIINDVLHIIFNSNIVPPHFRELPNKNLVNAYTNVYNKLNHMKDNFPSQPSTPENESRKKTKGDSPKQKATKSKNSELNRKREKQELSSDNEDDDEEGESVTESIAHLASLKKKVKTESDRLTQGTSAMEEISASPRPPIEIMQPIKQQQLPVQQKPQILQNKPETSIKISNPQKIVQPKPSSSMKVESEHFDIKSESEHHLDQNPLAKMKGMLGVNNLSDIEAAALMKGVNPRPGMMNETLLQALRQQQSLDNLKANKLNIQLPGSSIQSNAGLPFGTNPLQTGNDSQFDMISNLPEQMRNQLMMSALYQNSGKNLQNKNEVFNKNQNMMSNKGFPFVQQQQSQSQLPPQLGAQFLQQHSQLQLQQQLAHAQAQLQAQDFGKEQSLMSNDFGNHSLLNQLFMQQQLGNYMMGGNGPNTNNNFAASLLAGGGLNSNHLAGGFQGLVGNNQGNSQVEGLLRSMNAGQQNLNMASLMANLGKLGGPLGNLQK